MIRSGAANVVQLSALNHPNVITGKDIIPGAVTRQVTLRRIFRWTRPLMLGEKVDNTTFKVPHFLAGIEFKDDDGMRYAPLEVGEVRKITEPSFSYMVLGEFPPLGDQQLIAPQWIMDATQRYEEYEKLRNMQRGVNVDLSLRPVLGVDVAEFGADYNVVCIRYGPLVKEFRMWKGLDTYDTAIKIVEIAIEVNAESVIVDATGVGAGVAPIVGRRLRSYDVRVTGVKVSERPTPFVKLESGEFYQVRDQLWWQVRLFLKDDKNAMIPPDGYLLEELKLPIYSMPSSTGGKIRIMLKETMRDLLKRSPDRADALCMTFYPSARAKVLPAIKRN
jgi:hypothetical protein